MFWSTPARWTGPLRAPQTRWPAPVGAWCCRGTGTARAWAGRAFRVTVVAPIVRTRYEQGSAARREAPWRRPPAPRRHRSARPAGLGTAPHRDHLPAAGIAPRSARPRARPPAAHHAQARPPGLDDIDDDLSRSCGGDMSTPQKCPPTRHYLQTTSDNRRSGRMSARYRSRHWMYRFGPSALGLASPARRCGQRRPGPKDALCGVTGRMGWGDTFTCTVCIAGRSRLTAAPRGSNARVPAGGWWRDFWPCRFQGRSACTAGMRVKLAAGRTLALAVAIASLALAGCGSGGGPARQGRAVHHYPQAARLARG